MVISLVGIESDFLYKEEVLVRKRRLVVRERVYTRCNDIGKRKKETNS